MHAAVAYYIDFTKRRERLEKLNPPVQMLKIPPSISSVSLARSQFDAMPSNLLSAATPHFHPMQSTPVHIENYNLAVDLITEPAHKMPPAPNISRGQMGYRRDSEDMNKKIEDL